MLGENSVRMQGISRVFNHVRGRCVLGYKLLLSAFFEGKTTILCDFSLHQKKGKKETKLYLGLGGYQGCDFNGQIADATLCYLTYTVMALEKRFTEYQTMDELFFRYEGRPHGTHVMEESSCLYRAHSSCFRRNAWGDAPTPYTYNQRQRQRVEQNPCNG